MRKLLVAVFVAGLLSFGSVSPGHGGDLYLWMDGLRGEATEKGHKDWIPVFSFTSEAHGPGFVQGARATMSPLTIVKFADTATPSLALKSLLGEVLKNVVLDVCESGVDQRVYLRLTLNDVVVISTKLEIPEDKSVPRTLEKVSLSFAKIKWEYIPKSGAPEKAGYDLRANVKQ